MWLVMKEGMWLVMKEGMWLVMRRVCVVRVGWITRRVSSLV